MGLMIKRMSQNYLSKRSKACPASGFTEKTEYIIQQGPFNKNINIILQHYLWNENLTHQCQ